MAMTGVAVRTCSAILAAVLLAGCGAVPPSPSAAPTASSSPTATATGINREQAITVARAAVPRYASADVLSASVGRFIDSVTEYTAAHLTPAPAPDRLVWRVTLGEHGGPTGGEGTVVIVDFWDGRFILSTDFIG
jgi:hypothetical protein